jgi:hypothetical protein
VATIIPSGSAKSWDACPIRIVLADRLVDRKIRPEDAVFVWDFVEDSTMHTNIEVGLLPAMAFSHAQVRFLHAFARKSDIELSASTWEAALTAALLPRSRQPGTLLRSRPRKTSPLKRLQLHLEREIA